MKNMNTGFVSLWRYTMNEQMSPTTINLGDTVANSPAGAGIVESFSDGGFPCVNGTYVTLLVRTDGVVYNPYGLDVEAAIAQWQAVDDAAQHG